MMKQPLPVFPKPLDDLLKKVGRSSKAYAQELAKKLARYSQEVIESLVWQQTQKADQINRSIEESYQSVVELCKKAIRGPDIKIEVSVKDIKKAQQKSSFFASTAELV